MLNICRGSNIISMAVMDMTKGSIVRSLVSYTIPPVLGNLFQLAYNVVDSMIAGHFIGAGALAATGMASPVINILILGISGICIGAGVLMSNFFGSKDMARLKRELSTLLVSGTLFSIVLTAVAIIFTNPLLRILNVPADLHHDTAVYLRIIFIGVPFTYFYNALSQALKSVGDSKTPLKFLMASSVLNCGLDLFFVGYMGFGITCSAVTTTVAQAASSLLCFAYIYRKVPLLSLRTDELKIDRSLLRTTLSYGTVTALQQSVQPVHKPGIGPGGLADCPPSASEDVYGQYREQQEDYHQPSSGDSHLDEGHFLRCGCCLLRDNF